MFCTKKSWMLLVLSAISIIGSLQATSSDSIKDHLKMLFCTSNECNNLNAESKRDFDMIEQEARKNVNDPINRFLSWLTSDQEIIQKTVRQCVKERAYKYACFLGASYSHADNVSKKIAAMVKEEERRADLRGTFSQFLGKALEYKVETLLTDIRSHEGISPSSTLEHIEYCSSTDYSLDEDPCVACLEIVSKKRRVFLPDEVGNVRKYSSHKMMYQGCGHFLCIGCTQNWFFNENNNTCPVCRAVVNKALLQDIIGSKNSSSEQDALLSENRYNPAPEGYSYQPGAQYPQPSAPPYYD